jgi:hypothetical protein
MYGLMQCALTLPTLLVWLAGGVLIGGRMSSNRAVARLALGGIAVGVLNIILGIASTIAVQTISSSDTTVDRTLAFYTSAGIIQAVVSAISWGLVLAAVIMALGKPDTASTNRD